MPQMYVHFHPVLIDVPDNITNALAGEDADQREVAMFIAAQRATYSIVAHNLSGEWTGKSLVELVEKA
jgi:hypothetical protein